MVIVIDSVEPACGRQVFNFPWNQKFTKTVMEQRLMS